jgi:hypothetical protein
MLHAFLWGLSILSDYRAAQHAIDGAFALGLLNVGLLGIAGTCAIIRARVGPRSRSKQRSTIIQFPGRQQLHF